MAAFSISGYASTYTRAGQKPFNPVLGETYESIREDKGWKFVAEQVGTVYDYRWNAASCILAYYYHWSVCVRVSVCVYVCVRVYVSLVDQWQMV